MLVNLMNSWPNHEDKELISFINLNHLFNLVYFKVYAINGHEMCI
jgi:hypothetical protein